MIPYKIHLDDWTVAMYATDGGLTFTVTNSSEPENYMTRVVGDVRLRRYYIGRQCAGELHPSPWPTYQDGTAREWDEDFGWIEAADTLPTDGAKITPSMLDSKADLKALIDDSKRWTKEAILAKQGAG
jgi:hypothetical protein|tara:strand:+ start:438 stop:821 length:384 start_codon:yes stop_codon:yes gene_type:complete